jgi:hypothetical protein
MLPLALAASGTDPHIVSRSEFTFKMDAKRTITSSGEFVQDMRVGYIRTGTLRTAMLQPEEVGLLDAS